MNNSLNIHISFWNSVAKVAIVAGLASMLYYLIVGTFNIREFLSLFFATGDPRGSLVIAKVIVISCAILLGIALIMRTVLTRKHLKQQTPIASKSINALFRATLLFYTGCYIIGYYVFLIATIRVDLGEATWGLVAGLSVVIYAPLLIIGIALSTIGAVLSRKAAARIA